MKFRKLAAALIALAMILTMMTAIAESNEYEPKAYTIAVGVPSSGMTMLEVAANSINQIASLTNGTAMFASAMDAGSDPDSCISFVEQSIAGGADGIVIMPPADSVLPTICRMCEQAGVYFSLTMRSIVDEEIKAMVEASEYYVGNVYEDEVAVGRLAGQMIIDEGWTNVALISTSKGNTTGDTREQGLLEVLEANGAKLVGEARGQTQASELGDDVASLIVANPDLDVIFQAATFAMGGADAAIVKIQETGKDIKYVAVDGPTDVETAFNSGIMPWYISASGKASLFYDTVVSTIKCVNAIQGFKLVDEGKTCSETMIKAVVIETAEDAAALSAAGSDATFYFYTDEDLANYFAWNNPDLTAATLQEMVQSYDPITMSPYFK